MAIICWGNLAKAANDTLKIEQSIMGYVETHDENPNAHMGEDYALGAHRLATMLDHSPYSVFNRFLYPQSRSYRAVVDPSGNGDVTTIQAGIDYANSIGGGVVYIKAGTYLLTSNITLYSNVKLVGEDMDRTIIDFNDGTYQILAVGTSGAHKSNIEIRDLQVKDCGIYDNPAIKMVYCDNSEIVRVKIDGSHYAADPTTWAIWATNCSSTSINGCKITNNDHGIRVYDSYITKIDFNEIGDTARFVLSNTSSSGTFFRNNYCETNGLVTDDCIIYLAGTFTNGVFDSNVLLECRCTCMWNEGGTKISIMNNIMTNAGDGLYGIALNGVDHCNISNNRIDDFAGDGIILGSDSNENNIIGNTVINNDQYGIHIDDADCDKNLIVGNIVTGNTTAGVKDDGTNTEVAHNRD